MMFDWPLFCNEATFTVPASLSGCLHLFCKQWGHTPLGNTDCIRGSGVDLIDPAAVGLNQLFEF